MSLLCSKCDICFSSEDSVLCDCCGDHFHEKCVDLLKSETDILKLNRQRALLFFCDACLNSFKKIPKLLTHYESGASDVAELKCVNNKLNQQCTDLQEKLGQLEKQFIDVISVASAPRSSGEVKAVLEESAYGSEVDSKAENISDNFIINGDVQNISNISHCVKEVGDVSKSSETVKEFQSDIGIASGELEKLNRFFDENGKCSEVYNYPTETPNASESSKTSNEEDENSIQKLWINMQNIPDQSIANSVALNELIVENDINSSFLKHPEIDESEFSTSSTSKLSIDHEVAFTLFEIQLLREETCCVFENSQEEKLSDFSNLPEVTGYEDSTREMQNIKEVLDKIITSSSEVIDENGITSCTLESSEIEESSSRISNAFSVTGNDGEYLLYPTADNFPTDSAELEIFADNFMIENSSDRNIFNSEVSDNDFNGSNKLTNHGDFESMALKTQSTLKKIPDDSAPQPNELQVRRDLLNNKNTNKSVTFGNASDGVNLGASELTEEDEEHDKLPSKSIKDSVDLEIDLNELDNEKADNCCDPLSPEEDTAAFNILTISKASYNGGVISVPQEEDKDSKSFSDKPNAGIRSIDQFVDVNSDNFSSIANSEALANNSDVQTVSENTTQVSTESQISVTKDELKMSRTRRKVRIDVPLKRSDSSSIVDECEVKSKVPNKRRSSVSNNIKSCYDFGKGQSSSGVLELQTKLVTRGRISSYGGSTVGTPLSIGGNSSCNQKVRKVRSQSSASGIRKTRSKSIDETKSKKSARKKGADVEQIPAKKSTVMKIKKITSPKIASPKMQSPKVTSPKLLSATTPASRKVGSPRVNLKRLEQSDEEKQKKTTKPLQPPKAPNTTADSGPESGNNKSVPEKVKVPIKAKTAKKLLVPAKPPAPSNEESRMGKKINSRKSAAKLSPKPVTSDSLQPKKKTLKINNITNQSNDKTGESKYMENYLQNLSYGYNTLLYVFQYLKVQDLLRAGCVCTMWRDIASHSLLWRTVRMKNSQVHSFEGLANTLQKHGTVQLDLRKMLLTNCDEIWPEFSSNIGKVDTLRKIELCRCPASVVEKLTESNTKLEVVNALTIRCESMNLEGLVNWTNLRELRLKSTTGLTLTSDIESLKSLVNLKTLSLTSIRDLNTMKLDVIAELTNLESLDLGECTDFPETFGNEILSKLTKLERLRLEKGQGNCHTFEILSAVKDMNQLEQLELVNFDIKAGFDKALGACKNIKKLLIIPTYISQSATTNHMVLGGVLRLQKSLSHFVWGVTLELLRVTELFVDQCEDPEKKKEKKVVGNGDSIPVLKPVPLITDDNSEIPPALDPPQVEILALPGLQKLLLQSMPTTRVKILKIPFHATWRQSITDAVN